MIHRDDCASIMRQLWPFLDDALPPSWQARVLAHLESCANCRSHVDFEREFMLAVRSAGTMSDAGGDALHARVLDALAAQGFAAP